MRKKILKVFFVILTGITVTLTGCELSGKLLEKRCGLISGKEDIFYLELTVHIMNC